MHQVVRTSSSEIEHVSSAPKFLSPSYKRIGSGFSCAYIELWMHLGSLESTQEARVARGAAGALILRSFRALQTSRVHP